MNWDDSTGGDVSFQRQGSLEVPLAHESVSGERLAPGIVTLGSQLTAADGRRGSTGPSARPSDSLRRIPEREERKRRRCLKACLEDLGRALSSTGDPVLKANSLADVRRHLQALWEMVEGSPSSEAFEEVVNMLQIALCVEEPEALLPRQLDAIASVLRKMHDDPDVDDQTANDMTQELIRGGIDVFREIG